MLIGHRVLGALDDAAEETASGFLIEQPIAVLCKDRLLQIGSSISGDNQRRQQVCNPAAPSTAVHCESIEGLQKPNADRSLPFSCQS